MSNTIEVAPMPSSMTKAENPDHNERRLNAMVSAKNVTPTSNGHHVSRVIIAESACMGSPYEWMSDYHMIAKFGLC